jgi:hypothetical protein
MTATDLLIVVIHNNEEYVPARLVAENLRRMLPDTAVVDVHQQDALSTNTNMTKLKGHLITQSKLEERWREYRGLQSLRKRLLAKGNLCYKLCFLRAANKKRQKEWKIRQIERAVSLKHQIAWKLYSESKAKRLLVLESDAVWIDIKSDLVANYIDYTLRSTPAYVNLAGGLDFELLGVDSLRLNDDHISLDNAVFFSRPVTNTSCAYAINQPMAKQLLDHLEVHPDLESLGIDWLINSTFIETVTKGIEVICLHASPPVLLHGSISGNFKSWHPDRN